MTQLEVTSPYDGSVVGRVNRAGDFRICRDVMVR
jgi:hypothetical protein